MVDILSAPSSHHYDEQNIEMDEPAMTAAPARGQSRRRLLPHQESYTGRAGAVGDGRLAGVARHTLGIILLLCVVFLWTLCNFLGSVRSPVRTSRMVALVEINAANSC
jgi:hypothetical protein